MRTFTSASNYLEVNHSFALAPVGCVVFYFRPNWDGYDNGTEYHVQFRFSNAGGDVLDFTKTPPINDGNPLPWPEYIYTGPATAGTDRRILIDSLPSGYTEGGRAFRDNEGAWWQVTWDAPNGCSWLFKNGGNVGGTLGRPAHHIPYTMPVFTKLQIGGVALANTANGDIGEFAIFDYHLSDQQREDMMLTGIAALSPAPTYWWKILGDQSPEPAVIGPALTVVGTPPKAAFAHPTSRPVPPPITKAMKPTSGTPLHPENPLNEDLIWAMPFNEGLGSPREHVSGLFPTLEAAAFPDGLPAWQADGSLHFQPGTQNAFRWDGVNVFDGLRAFTMCFSHTLDLFTSASGPEFAFPNTNNPMLFGKELCCGYSQGDASQSVFGIYLNHDDEVEGSNGHIPNGSHLGKGSGGRWGYWTMTGRGTGPPQGAGFPSLEGIDTWYVWRGTWWPWNTRFRQMFFIYDCDAPPEDRWICRVNGRREYPADTWIDVPMPLEVTPAPVVLGAMNVSPFALSGGMHGKWQYLYVWAGVKPDVWQPLLDNPYALYQAPPEPGSPEIHTTDQIELRATLEIWNLLKRGGLTDPQVAGAQTVDDIVALARTKVFTHSEDTYLHSRIAKHMRLGAQMGFITDADIATAQTLQDVFDVLLPKVPVHERSRDIYSGFIQTE